MPRTAVVLEWLRDFKDENHGWGPFSVFFEDGNVSPRDARDLVFSLDPESNLGRLHEWQIACFLASLSYDDQILLFRAMGGDVYRHTRRSEGDAHYETYLERYGSDHEKESWKAFKAMEATKNAK